MGVKSTKFKIKNSGKFTIFEVTVKAVGSDYQCCGDS